MQKSIKFTIIFILGICLYAILGSTIFIQLNDWYIFVINPIFWIFVAILLKVLLGKVYETKRAEKEIIQYTLIAVLTYVIVELISGLFVTFGHNPYKTTLQGFFYNMWITGSIIIAREYIRYKLINNVYDKDKTKIAIIVSIAFSLIEFGVISFLSRKLTIYYIIVKIAKELIPIAAKNALYSYLSINKNFKAAICYAILTNVYYWTSPILPNSPWIMTAIIETVIPVILLLYIRYTKNKKSIFKSREQLINSDPRNYVPLVIVVILAIWFAIGIFPIKPVAIASGSMASIINVGDVVIIKKCEASDIEVNDIIEYQMDGYTVIHRVIEIKRENRISNIYNKR